MAVWAAKYLICPLYMRELCDRGDDKMKRRSCHFLIATATIVALCVVCLCAHAQTKSADSSAGNSKKGTVSEAGPPAPRMADGHPDLSGVYFPGPQDPDKYAL